MGYTTDFEGEFKLDKSLAPEHAAYLHKFATTRRMKRDADKAEGLDDPVRVAAGLPIGEEGGYFVGAEGLMGQDEDPSMTEYNSPPSGQPGLWCQWIPGEGGETIVWDEGEKFYYYREWLIYLVEHFLGPWGYTLSGEVRWSGDEDEDLGILYAKDNKVQGVASYISNDGPLWA